MKEVRESKQTVWILTMLTVMIVLSAYYLVSDPTIYNEVLNQKNETDEIVDILTTDIENFDNQELIDQIGTNTSDFIIGLKMERSSSRSKQIDQLYTMMQNDLSEEAIVDIQGKIEELQAIEEAEFVLEKLIVADGYNDAAIITNEDTVDVIIQTDYLSNAEAVKIIKMVSDRLEVPAVNVHIKVIN